MVEFNEDIHIRGNPPADSAGLPQRATKRLRVDSWEKSNRANRRAGDAIALHWMRPEAKAFIGWWDSSDPDNPECKAWLGAHDEANNPAAVPHRHFSIEVTDATGQMQTRLGIPYDKDHTNITTTSADFTVVGGKMRIPSNSRLEFSADKHGEDGSRWQVRRTTDGGLSLLYYASPGSDPERIVRINPATNRIEVEALSVNDLILTDIGTGAPTKLYVENGQVKAEEI